MELLSEDGLEEDVKNIKPPTNDDIINLMNGIDLKPVSVFSIINDNTLQAQCSDQTIKDLI
jgi:hypothetical protein